MNRPLRRISLIIIILFLTLMMALTYIQFFAAPSLNADSRNVRTLYKEFGIKRGSIIVDGKEIVKSVPATGPYKFQRQYSDGEIYSAITGYFSVADTSITGIERAENPVLGGSADSLAVQRLQELITGDSPTGGSISLTINQNAQRAAYHGLAGKRGAVVALEPSTGKILALVSTPSFDPNKIASLKLADARNAWKSFNEDKNKPLLNRAIGGDIYAPGSVFKIITAAAMLENGATPDTVIDAPTRWSPPGTSVEITNTSGACGDGSGKTDLRTSLKLSCNTPFAIAGMNLGIKKMTEISEKFGFHQKLNIPLAVRPSVFPHTTDPAALAMDSFGQRDIQTSPLQMAMVAAAVANNGVIMKPYLVDQVLTRDLEVVKQSSPQEFSRPISATSAAALHEMMIEVAKHLRFYNSVPGTKVAGKTGTAELGKNVNPHAWFVAFDSAEKPKVAVAVFVENGGWGYQVAAPIGISVINAVLNK